MKSFGIALLFSFALSSVAMADPAEGSNASLGPLHRASGWARDLIADKPMPPVRQMNADNLKIDTLSPFDYSFSRFADQSKSIPLELGVASAAIVGTGILGWHWGDSKFHFEHDCWFCRETHDGGLDKAGHMFTGYILTDLLAQSIQGNAADSAGAQYTSAIYAMTLMTSIEVLDGFTKKYGFSRDDLAADAIGVGLGIARNMVPGFREKLDFRIMYTPPGYELPGDAGGRLQLIPPYHRTRYIAALKLSGFEALHDTAFRYVELQGGFDARGYTSLDHKLGYEKRQNLYVGIGLNLNELLFGRGPLPNLSAYRDNEAAWAVSNVLERVQIPYTAYYSGRN